VRSLGIGFDEVPNGDIEVDCETRSELHVSPKTVEVHRPRIREKLRVTSAAELISYAARWSETHGVS
jgi:hypothetical protein